MKCTFGDHQTCGLLKLPNLKQCFSLWLEMVDLPSSDHQGYWPFSWNLSLPYFFFVCGFVRLQWLALTSYYLFLAVYIYYIMMSSGFAFSWHGPFFYAISKIRQHICFKYHTHCHIVINVKRVAIFKTSLKLVWEEVGTQLSSSKNKCSTSHGSDHLCMSTGHCK